MVYWTITLSSAVESQSPFLPPSHFFPTLFAFQKDTMQYYIVVKNNKTLLDEKVLVVLKDIVYYHA